MQQEGIFEVITMVKPTAFDLWDSGIHPSSRAQIANHSKSIAILERAGFNDDSFRIGDLVGRTIALNRSMFHCLFLMYKISGIAETEHGFIVVPVSDEVRFYGNVEGKLSYLSQPVSNLELYVPKFYMSQTH